MKHNIIIHVFCFKLHVHLPCLFKLLTYIYLVCFNLIMFIRINDFKTPKERMVAAVRYMLSAFHAARKVHVRIHVHCMYVCKRTSGDHVHVHVQCTMHMYLYCKP